MKIAKCLLIPCLIMLQANRRIKLPGTARVPKLPPIETESAVSLKSPRVEPNQTLIDGVVADYLHFARYGHIIPVYEGTSTTACPCCNERNKQNVQSLLGIPRKNATWSEAWKVPRDKSGEQTKHPMVLYPRTGLNYQPLTYAHNYLNPEFNRPTAVYNYYTDRAYDSGDPYVSNQIISADNRFDESMKRLHKYGNESS
ncbi:hypothetical protein KUTeg_011481 [Tegillarca granosa]|uniref:Uncharacterized protein n=1 Tax=Tegillarca granosa TaxID=220873 RepID=A0ABQ9F3Y1_TEGGR|nr:hypothetical protein KUTeg_011481 [Tegillarca granosa]